MVLLCFGGNKNLDRDETTATLPAPGFSRPHHVSFCKAAITHKLHAISDFSRQRKHTCQWSGTHVFWSPTPWGTKCCYTVQKPLPSHPVTHTNCSHRWPHVLYSPPNYGRTEALRTQFTKYVPQNNSAVVCGCCHAIQWPPVRDEMTGSHKKLYV